MTTVGPRAMFRVVEPYHAFSYFVEETAEELSGVGLRGGWMRYIAGRAAPMGAVSAAAVDATFVVFAPARVNRALPDAWRLASPEAVVGAKLRAADRALRRLLGEAAVASPEMAEAADLARRAASVCETAGRPLSAAWATVPWPGPAHLDLWLATTILREHRGCGHMAALVVAGLDGCEAQVSAVAAGGVRAEDATSELTGWTEADWKAAESRLAARGWLTPEGRLTAEGRARRRELEDSTDRLAASPWRALGDEASRRLAELLLPFCTPLVAQVPGNPFPSDEAVHQPG